jgi:hypothetical protein
MGASLANAAPSGNPTARSGSVLVFVFGGSAFTFSVPFSFSPIMQQGGMG